MVRFISELYITKYSEFYI